MTEPAELANALAVLALCDRFHKLPSEVLAEPAEVFQMIALERRYAGG